MAFEREQRLDAELRRLLDDLATLPTADAAVPGKRTRVEQMSAELARQELGRAGKRAMVPGRRTLVQRLVSEAPKLGFHDSLVLALREVLKLLDDKDRLRAAALAAAEPDAARRVSGGSAAPAGDDDGAAADGQAMWKVAERRAATL